MKQTRFRITHPLLSTCLIERKQKFFGYIDLTNLELPIDWFDTLRVSYLLCHVANNRQSHYFKELFPLYINLINNDKETPCLSNLKSETSHST
jgi:hypothetical protein